MKKLKYSSLLLFLFGWALSIHASDSPSKKALTKEIHKTFDVDSDVLLGVQNRYGDVKIVGWDNNEVQVDVFIKVKSINHSKGQTFLDGVKVDFSHSNSKLGMKTEYPSQDNSSWWDSWWGDGKNIEFEVHYNIQAPHGMSTKLINKYGNIYQSNIGGSSTITNKYGDIILQDVGGDLTVDLGYGNASVGDVQNTTVEIKYSSFKIGDCKDVTITSKYSEFHFGACENFTLSTKYDDYEIESAHRIVNSGKYDDFKIGKVGNVIFDTKNTSIKVDHLENQGVFDTRYGSVTVRSIGDIKGITVDSKYTNYKFNVQSNFHLNFYGTYSDLNIAQPYEKYHYIEDGNDIEAKVFRGSKNGKANIVVNMKYGGLKLYNNQ